MKPICIYQITHLESGKRYIGQSVDPEKRWREHCLSDSVIGKAIRRHGVNAFDFTILVDGLSTRQANMLEASLIASMNTLRPNGYNVRKARVRRSVKMRYSDTEMQRIAANQRRGDHPNKGRKQSPEHIAKRVASFKRNYYRFNK